MESKEILGIMGAYASIYEKKEEPEMEEGEKEESEKDEGGKHKEGKHKKGKEEKGEKEMKEEIELEEGRWNNPRWNEHERQRRIADQERGRPETESETHGRLMLGKFRPGASKEERAEGGRQRLKDRNKVPKKDGKDMFEHILEHLVAEGYADTNKAALAIMANMSEEWKWSIVEELEQLDEISDRKVQQVVNTRNRRFDRSVDSGAPNKEFYQARRSNKLAARRNERTGSNVKVDPDFAG